MAAVTWSILIASHSSRTGHLTRLVSLLEPQLVEGVEVVVLWNRGAKTIGEYRQALVDDAQGEWVSFVDDDDRIADGYCNRILTALNTDPDYVGFRVAVKDMSNPPINRRWRNYEAVHSIRYDRWHQKGNKFFRHVSHLNPIRRELALRAPFEGQQGEDHRWADLVRPFVKTEVFIDDVLYLYDFNQQTSLRSSRPDRVSYVRRVLPDGFRYHPNSEG